MHLLTLVVLDKMLDVHVHEAVVYQMYVIACAKNSVCLLVCVCVF